MGHKVTSASRAPPASAYKTQRISVTLTFTQYILPIASLYFISHIYNERSEKYYSIQLYRFVAKLWHRRKVATCKHISISCKSKSTAKIVIYHHKPRCERRGPGVLLSTFISQGHWHLIDYTRYQYHNPMFIVTYSKSCFSFNHWREYIWLSSWYITGLIRCGNRKGIMRDAAMELQSDSPLDGLFNGLIV